jgi:hypothetical protein
VTTGDDRTRLQALSLINDCYKYKMDLTTNGVVITDAIKLVQMNKEKLVSTNGEDKESKKSDYSEDKDQLEEKQEQEEETRELTKQEETTNHILSSSQHIKIFSCLMKI